MVEGEHISRFVNYRLWFHYAGTDSCVETYTLWCCFSSLDQPSLVNFLCHFVWPFRLVVQASCGSQSCGPMWTCLSEEARSFQTCPTTTHGYPSHSAPNALVNNQCARHVLQRSRKHIPHEGCWRQEEACEIVLNHLRR